MKLEKYELSDSVSLKKGHCHSSVFVANSAQLIGQVFIDQYSSIWYQSVLRADINRIMIGKRSNIQDSTVIHLENDLPCIVGDDVTVGHRAILHACEVKNAALIGMGAIVLNGAVIGSGAVIAAGAVIKENTHVPDCTLWAGVPAKQVKSLDSSIIINHQKWAAKYVKLAAIHKQ